MPNIYLEKIASMSKIVNRTSKMSAERYGENKADSIMKKRSLRMGPHTTPEDLLPNPRKMRTIRNG